MSTMDNNKPQLMITDEQHEDIIDFLDYSLSNAEFGWKDSQNVEARQVSQNSFSSNTEKEQFSSNVHSPHGNFIVHSKQSTDQKVRCDTTSSQQTKTYSNLIQYFIMKKFVYHLSWKKKLNSQFSKYHFDVINDKGSSFNIRLFQQNAIQMKPMIQKPVAATQKRIVKTISQTKQHFQNMIDKVGICINKIPLIYPESRLKVLWDILIMCVRFYFIFVIPLDLSWDHHQFMFNILWDYTLTMILLLIFDLILSFNNAFYEFGQIVTDRKKIANNVVYRGYGTEILSLFILIFFMIFSVSSKTQININDDWYYLLLLLFLVHYKNIAKLTEQVEEALNLSKQISSLLELMKLILLLFYVLHIFTCLWYWIGNYSAQNEGRSWLITKELHDKDWSVQYLYSFYFSTVTMFTVGYGDITPQTQAETIICIGFMMICSIQLSYSVSTVGAIIDKISAYSKEKMKKIQTITTYMQNRKISYELQYQIREYLTYFWQSSNQEETEEEKEIINQLSVGLRERLMFEANSMILNSCPLFKNHFSDQLKKKLVKQIKSVLIQPENIIDFDSIFTESKNQLYICFIESGEIEIFFENESQKNNIINGNQVSVVFTVKQGSSLGLMSFITGTKAIERFRSVGFTKLLLLSREDFLKTIIEFPEDYEIFREMQDDLIFNEDSKFLKLKCFSCQSNTHRAIACPMLHLVPDREMIIKRHQYSTQQYRNQYESRFKSNPNKYLRNPYREKNMISALSELQEIQESAECIVTDNPKFFQFYEVDEEEPEDTDTEIQQYQYAPIFQPQQKMSILKSTSRPSTISRKVSTSQALEDIQEEDEDEVQRHTKKTGTVARKSGFKGIARKSQSFVVEDFSFKKESGVSKFKKAVEMIKSLNKMQTRKTLKVQTRNLLQSIFGSQQHQKPNTFIQMKLIDKRLDKVNKSEHELSDKEIDQLQFLKMKIHMLQEEQIIQMETVRTFKFYYKHNNIDQVLDCYEQFYLPQLRKYQNIPQLFSSLVKYLQYPYIYINKYKFREDQFTIQKQTETSSPETKHDMHTLATHRQSKSSKKGKKIQQVKPV